MIHVTMRSLSLASFFTSFFVDASSVFQFFFCDRCTLREKQSPVYHSSRYVMYSGDVSLAQRRCSHWAAVWKVLKPKAFVSRVRGEVMLGCGTWFQLLESLNITKQPKIGYGRLNLIWTLEGLQACLGVWIGVKIGLSTFSRNVIIYFFRNKAICPVSSCTLAPGI